MPDLTELTAKDWSDNDDHELIFKLLEIIGCPCKTNAIINNFFNSLCRSWIQTNGIDGLWMMGAVDFLFQELPKGPASCVAP